MTNYISHGVLSPIFEEAEVFLEALAGKDAQFTFQTFDDVKVWNEDKKKFVNRADKTLTRIYQGTFNQHKAALAALNAKGAGVYVTVNQTDLKGRKEANIVKVRALFVDLDGSPIQPIKDLPEDLQPHIIIESSPNRWHAYWLVNNCELEQFKQLQQALAALFDGDETVCDLPRVMRLAGFSHNKKDPFITRIVELQESNLAPFSVNKLIVGLGLNNKKIEDEPAIVAISAIDDDFTTGLPPEADVINDLKNALSFLSCEDYKEWSDVGQELKPLGKVGLDLWLAWSSTSAKFDKEKAIHKWEYELEGTRTSYRAIFNKAKANGWINPLSSHHDPEEWQDPESINAHYEALDYPLEQLPDPLRLLIVEVVDYLQCPIAMAVNSLLGALSLCTQGLVNVARDSQLTSVSSLFLLLIAESGERKSACDGLLTKHLKELDIERFKADYEAKKLYQREYKKWQVEMDGALNALKRASEKGLPDDGINERINNLYLQEPIAPRGTTFLLEDTTPEGLTKALDKGHPSQGIFSSEAGVVFGSHGMNSESAMRNMATLNKFWDGESHRKNRSDSSNDMLLSGRRLTLNLAIQASTVRAFFDGTKGLARGTGFGARFLIAWPKSTQGTRFYKEPVSHTPQLAAFKRRTLELINTPLTIDYETGAIQTHNLILSTKAKAVWTKFFNDTEQELRTGGELTNIKDVTSKAADNATRIAALFHVYEHGITGAITEDHMTRACHLMFWYLLESRRFFGEIALPKEISNATLLDAWLLDYCKDNSETRISTMLARQLCPNSLRSKAVHEETVKSLTELSRIRTVKDGKKKWLEVNPKLLEV